MEKIIKELAKESLKDYESVLYKYNEKIQKVFAKQIALTAIGQLDYINIWKKRFRNYPEVIKEIEREEKITRKKLKNME